jgi:hypothetical protein
MAAAWDDVLERVFVLAALATITVAAPTIASAEEFGVRVGGDGRHD